jgi:hypothetical protein
MTGRPIVRATYAKDVLGLTALYAQLAVTLWIMPSWSPVHAAEPVYLAAVGAVLTTLTITGLRLAGKRGSRAEQRLLATFLAGMPLVYVASWLVTPEPGWLVPEIVGVIVFGALALAGLSRSPWFLAAGIASHGVFWDAWHYGRTSFVPSWYELGCLVADIGFAIYVATQIPSYALTAPSASETREPRA